MSITRSHRDGITETRYPIKKVRRADAPHTKPRNLVDLLVARGLPMEQIAKIVMFTGRYDLKRSLYQRLMTSSDKSNRNILILYPGLKPVPSTDMLVDILQSSTSKDSPMTTRQISNKMYKGVKSKPRKYNKAVNRVLYGASEIQPLTILGRRGMIVRLDPAQGKKAPRWYWQDVDPDFPAEGTYFVGQWGTDRPRRDDYMPMLSDYLR